MAIGVVRLSQTKIPWTQFEIPMGCFSFRSHLELFIAVDILLHVPVLLNYFCPVSFRVVQPDPHIHYSNYTGECIERCPQMDEHDNVDGTTIFVHGHYYYHYYYI